MPANRTSSGPSRARPLTGSAIRLERHYGFNAGAAAVRSFLRILTAAFVAAAPASAGDQLALVFGPDDRRPLTAAENDLARVTGTLWRKENIEVASATILDHPSLPKDRTWDVVLTSAHTFVDTRGHFVHTRYWFSRGADPGNKVRVRAVYVAKNYSFEKIGPRNDWALAVTEQRLTGPGEGMLPLVLSERNILRRAASGGRLILVAHNYRTRTMQVSDNCSIIPKRLGDVNYGPRVFNMDCDMEVSASGGALMLEWAGRRYAAGVAAGDTHRRSHRQGAPFNPRRHVNLAVGLPPEMIVALRRLARTGKLPVDLP